MSTELRPAEGYSVIVEANGHKLAISPETALDPENFTFRPGDRDKGEYSDFVLVVSKPVMDGEDVERPGEVWCFVCGEWFKKGTHDANGPVKKVKATS